MRTRADDANRRRPRRQGNKNSLAFVDVSTIYPDSHGARIESSLPSKERRLQYMNKSYGSVESERFQQYMQMQRLCLVALFLLGCHHADAFVLPSSNGASRWISPFPYRRVFTFQRTTGSSVLYYKGDSGTSEKDFYSVLGITKTAGETEVKGAYRKLAKLYHPDANPDRDTTEQFKMLNRAYEVLRDPKLRQSYDAFGTKGIGTSAASDIENIKRRQPKPSSSTTTRASSTWASESTARTNGYASDIGSNWATGAKASSTGAGQRRSTSFTDEATVDPFSVNKRAPYTPKKESSEWSSAAYQDPGFRPRPQATSTSASEYQSGTQSGDKSAYYGDMGSVHAQRGHGTRFEDKLFETDGVTSGEAFFGRGPKFGRDVLINVQLDTNITRAGGKKMIEVKHMESCSTCRGTGTKDSSSTVKGCRHCGGTGYTTGSSMMRETCPVCNGSGRIVTNPCKSCQGLGMQEATKSIEVNIPRNVDDGYTLRVPGEGDAGPNGGPSGDLYVCFKVKGAPAKAAEQKPTGTSAPEQSRVRARSSVMSRKPANKPSSGLAPDQSRASTSVRPASSAPPKRPSGLRPDNIKAGLKPPVQQRMGVERSNPQRVSSESVARSQPQRASANSSTSRNVVERSRVPPAQAQANRFGSTRVVPPTANSESDIQPRRGRLRGIRNFVSNILNR